VLFSSPLFSSTYWTMSAILNFQSLLAVFLLVICACTYIRVEKAKLPAFIPFPMENTVGYCVHMFVCVWILTLIRFPGFLWKLSRFGERQSIPVGIGCLLMGFALLIW